MARGMATISAATLGLPGEPMPQQVRGEDIPADLREAAAEAVQAFLVAAREAEQQGEYPVLGDVLSPELVDGVWLHVMRYADLDAEQGYVDELTLDVEARPSGGEPLNFTFTVE